MVSDLSTETIERSFSVAVKPSDGPVRSVAGGLHRRLRAITVARFAALAASVQSNTEGTPAASVFRRDGLGSGSGSAAQDGVPRGKGEGAMARTVGSNGVRTAQAIRQAGVKLIYQHGYEAMSLRQLAAEVGLQSGSLYKYFENKQSLLFDIVRDHMDDLMAKADEALAGLTDPMDRLKAYVGFHLRYHMTRKAHVFIANMEIRSLEDEHRGEVVAMRRRYEGLLDTILRDGAAQGAFKVVDPRVSTYAIISMLTGICMWYRPEGRLSQDELVAIYTDLVTAGVAEPEAGLAEGQARAEAQRARA